MTTKPAVKVDVQRFDLAVRWSQVNFPFEQSKLLEILPERGYVLAQGVGGTAPFGSHIEVTGLVGRKGSLYLTLDAARPGLGVGGTDIVSVVDEFERVEELLENELHFNSAREARFFEVDAQVLIWSEISPIETFRGRSEAGNLTSRIGIVLGYEVAPAGLRFATADALPGSEEWHELLIEPSFRAPENNYHGLLVFRKRQWEPVKDVALRVADIFARLPGELGSL